MCDLLYNTCGNTVNEAVGPMINSMINADERRL